MLQRAVLQGLAVAADSGEELEAAWPELRRVDPLLRATVRRRVQRAYEDALLATTVGGPGSGAHLLRLAYLIAAGRTPRPDQLDDVPAVEAAYRRARTLAPAGIGARLPWPSALAALAVVAALGLGALALWRAAYPARPNALRRAAPPPRGAFLIGGRPATASPAVERAFAEDLPEYLLALDQLARAHRAGAIGPATEAEAALADARRRLTSPETSRALGAGASRRLVELLDRGLEASRARTGSADADVADDRFLETVGALDDELASAGLGFYLDGDVVRYLDGERTVVIVYAFVVERVRVWRAGGRAVRALQLRRLDGLNLAHALLGFTRPQLREALVLLDQVEEILVQELLPALADDAEMTVSDDEARGDAWARAAARRAGEAVRAELLELPGVDRAIAARLGGLLARRGELVAAWRRRLADQGYVVPAPDALRVAPSWAASLEGLVPAEELAELRRIDEALGTPAIGATVAAVREALLESIERHEVQHRLDFARARAPRLPPALQQYVGPAEHLGEERRGAARARDELSAYLAELARGERTTRLNLALLSRSVLDADRWGTAESYMGLVVLEGLAEELGFAPGQSLLQGGEIDRGQAGALLGLLLDRRPDEVRAAARRLWERLFGVGLEDLTT